MLKLFGMLTSTTARYASTPQMHLPQLIRRASRRPTNAEAGPLRLPLELILHIFELALPSSTMSPPNINPRLRFLLRLMRVCRVLQNWAEDRLYEGMITLQRSEGLWKMVACFKNSMEKAGRVRHLVLLLEENESTRRSKPRQDKAIAALLEVCTGVQVLRLQCPYSYRSTVELEPIAKLQGEARGLSPVSAELLSDQSLTTIGRFPDLRSLELYNINSYTSTSRVSTSRLGRHSATTLSPLPLQTLLLTNSSFTPSSVLINLRHLSLTASFLLPLPSPTFLPPLRTLHVGDEQASIDSLGGFPSLGRYTTLHALGIPFNTLIEVLPSFPATVRFLRLHAAQHLTSAQRDQGFGLLEQALREQSPTLAGLERVFLGGGVLQHFAEDEVEPDWEGTWARLLDMAKGKGWRSCTMRRRCRRGG